MGAANALARRAGLRYTSHMNSYLHQRIRERQARIGELKREIELASAELRAYEDALQHSDEVVGRASQPGTDVAVVPEKAAPSRRLPPPPPSHWPGIIATLARRGDKFTIDDVVAELATLRKPNTRKSVRAKLTDLVKEKRIARVSDGVFTAVPSIASDSTTTPATHKIANTERS